MHQHYFEILTMQARIHFSFELIFWLLNLATRSIDRMVDTVLTLYYRVSFLNQEFSKLSIKIISVFLYTETSEIRHNSLQYRGSEKVLS